MTFGGEKQLIFHIGHTDLAGRLQLASDHTNGQQQLPLYGAYLKSLILSRNQVELKHTYSF